MSHPDICGNMIRVKFPPRRDTKADISGVCLLLVLKAFLVSHTHFYKANASLTIMAPHKIVSAPLLFPVSAKFITIPYRFERQYSD